MSVSCDRENHTRDAKVPESEFRRSETVTTTTLTNESDVLNCDHVEKEIFAACRNGDLNCVKRLLDTGVEVNAKDTSGRRSTPLHFAAGYGRRAIVELLLERGGDVFSKDDGGLVPLHNACSFGHVGVVNLLLNSGSDPNSRDSWNFTPLHEAAIKGKFEVCIMLLQAKADPCIRNLDDKTPIDLAEGQTRLGLLGEWRIDELLEAARSGNEEKLCSLLTPQNVNCHAGDGRKSTPLHLAAGYNRTKIVRLLLAHGADVQAKDKGGLVPLHNACSYGHLEVCELLIAASSGAGLVDAADLWQYTPLHEAASKARAEVCSLLLAFGADPGKPNCHGKTPADLAPSPELRDRILHEHRGLLLLDACRRADYCRVKKLLSSSSGRNVSGPTNTVTTTSTTTGGSSSSTGLFNTPVTALAHTTGFSTAGAGLLVVKAATPTPISSGGGSGVIGPRHVASAPEFVPTHLGATAMTAFSVSLASCDGQQQQRQYQYVHSQQPQQQSQCHQLAKGSVSPGGSAGCDGAAVSDGGRAETASPDIGHSTAAVIDGGGCVGSGGTFDLLHFQHPFTGQTLLHAASSLPCLEGAIAPSTLASCGGGVSGSLHAPGQSDSGSFAAVTASATASAAGFVRTRGGVGGCATVATSLAGGFSAGCTTAGGAASSGISRSGRLLSGCAAPTPNGVR